MCEKKLCVPFYANGTLGGSPLSPMTTDNLDAERGDDGLYGDYDKLFRTIIFYKRCVGREPFSLLFMRMACSNPEGEKKAERGSGKRRTDQGGEGVRSRVVRSLHILH